MEAPAHPVLQIAGLGRLSPHSVDMEFFDAKSQAAADKNCSVADTKFDVTYGAGRDASELLNTLSPGLNQYRLRKIETVFSGSSFVPGQETNWPSLNGSETRISFATPNGEYRLARGS